MNQEDREDYLVLFDELQRAIAVGESATRETKATFDSLAEKIEQINAHAIGSADLKIPKAGYISVAGRWHRSSALKYVQSPLGTDGSRIHAGRYHKKNSLGALYATNDARTAAAERKLSVREQMFVTFPIDVKLQTVLDLSNKEACEAAGVIYELLDLEWEFVHDILEKTPYTQLIGDLARKHLFEAIQFESVRLHGTFNLVIFPEVMQINSSICVHDPEEILLNAHNATPENLVLTGILPTPT